MTTELLPKVVSSTAPVPPTTTRRIPSPSSSSRYLTAVPIAWIGTPNYSISLTQFQAAIIITFCRLLHYPLSRIRQPRVIAEVIGGILLGPSVMGRIPGFKDNIFPEESIPNLNLVATVGLVLFLFLVGVETDLRFLVSNWKVAVSVSAAGMVLPFGLGCAIAYGLFHAFRDDPELAPISFGTYMLFIGVAMAITVCPSRLLFQFFYIC